MFERPRTDLKQMTLHKTDVIGMQTLGGLTACTRLFRAFGKLLWLCILQ